MPNDLNSAQPLLSVIISRELGRSGLGRLVAHRAVKSRGLSFTERTEYTKRTKIHVSFNCTKGHKSYHHTGLLSVCQRITAPAVIRPTSFKTIATTRKPEMRRSGFTYYQHIYTVPAIN